MNINRFNKNKYLVILIYTVLVFPIYLYIGNVFGFIINELILIGSVFWGHNFSRLFGWLGKRNFRYVFLLYIIISFVGLLYVVDSVSNFGNQFGPNNDDSFYFHKALEGSNNLDLSQIFEIGIYEYFLSLYIFGLKILTLGSINVELIHILPLNWILSSLTVLLAGQLASYILKREIPMWVLIIALVFNFMYIDSTVRLYRDIFIVFFSLLAINLFINRDKVKSIFSVFIAFLSRGANAMMAIIYMAIYKITKRNKRFFLKSVISISGIILVLNFFGPYLFKFATDITRTDKGSRLYQMVQEESIQALIEARMEYNFEERQRGALASEAYQMGGLIGSSIRVGYTLFYPFSFIDFEKSIKYSTVDSEGYVHNGFFLSHLVNNISVLMWYIVIPFWFIGIVDFLMGTSLKKATVIYYFITVVLLTFISGQVRHNLIFIIFNPLFVAAGYFSCKEVLKRWHILLFALTAIMITLYNLI